MQEQVTRIKSLVNSLILENNLALSFSIKDLAQREIAFSYLKKGQISFLRRFFFFHPLEIKRKLSEDKNVLGVHFSLSCYSAPWKFNEKNVESFLLILDFDFKDKEYLCSEACVSDLKEYLRYLSFLFGDKIEQDVFFSGQKGFHIYLKNLEFTSLKSKKYLHDLLKGQFLVSHFLFPEKSFFVFSFLDWLNLKKKKELTSTDAFVLFSKEGAYFEDLKKEFFSPFFFNLDASFFVDYSKILRFEGVIHPKTGLLKKKLDLKTLTRLDLYAMFKLQNPKKYFLQLNKKKKIECLIKLKEVQYPFEEEAEGIVVEATPLLFLTFQQVVYNSFVKYVD